MGRGPEHHQAKQPPSAETDVARGGRSPHQGGDRSCQAADHDVLGGAGLQHHRVKQHIAAQTQQGKAGGQAVDPHHQQQGGAAGQSHGNGQGLGAA